MKKIPEIPIYTPQNIVCIAHTASLPLLNGHP